MRRTGKACAEHFRKCGCLLLATAAMAWAVPPGAAAQSSAVINAADSLVAYALGASPTIRATAARIDAARARVGPAGALPDPILAVGVMNVPVSGGGYTDMTMNTVGVGQMVPFPGKLALARRAAEMDVRAAEARLDAARLDVAVEVRRVYYELALIDRTLDVLRNNQKLLVNLIQVTESRYGVGTGGQQDVLKARVEASRLAEEAAAVTEQRNAAVARLNALLDRPTATPVPEARVPERIARAAVADDAARIRFSSGALGARAADSPLPPLDEVQARAIAGSPMLRAHEAEIAAQAARLELAQKGHLPDFDLSLQYGQRLDRSDMMSVMVSVPLPIHRKERQEQEVTEARAELAAMQAGHHEMVNRLRADVAVAYAAMERDRAQLALFVKSIIPQGRASLQSATSAYQVGRADFMTLLENQSTLYEYETAYFRAISGFATGLAELERTVGAEVLP